MCSAGKLMKKLSGIEWWLLFTITERKENKVLPEYAKKLEFKSDEENYRELLEEARHMKVSDIRIALRQRNALHVWAVRAYEKALSEKTGELIPIYNRPNK